MKRSGKRQNSYYHQVVKPKEVKDEPKVEHTIQRPDFGPSQVKNQWSIKTGSIVILVHEVGNGSTSLVRIIYTNLKGFVAEEFMADGSARRIHHGFWTDYSVKSYNKDGEKELWNNTNWIRLPTEYEVRMLQINEATWMNKKLGIGKFANRAIKDVPQTVYIPCSSGIGIRQLDLGED